MYATGLDNLDGGKWVLALEWLAVVGVFVLLRAETLASQ